MNYEQWETLRKDVYQARLYLLHSDKKEAIKLAEEEMDKAIAKIEALKPKNVTAVN